LREGRRRYLQNEKQSVLAQLEQLAASRTRLDAAILAADAETYQQSSLETATALGSKTFGAKHLTALFFAGVFGLVMLFALGALVALVLRRRRNERLRFTAQ
jgi:hypothetical protein